MAKRSAGSKIRKKRAAKKKAARPRAKRVAGSADDQSGWPYSRYSVWSQRWGNLNNDDQTYPTTVLLRHPTRPFVGTGDISQFESDMKKVAHDYLLAANRNPLIDPPLEIPDEWINALAPGQSSPLFGWLAFSAPSTQPSPLASFVALRTNASDNSSDPIVVMMASQLLASQPIGTGFGIRVVAHVRTSESQFEVRISGMSASLPFGQFRPTERPQRSSRAATARAQATALPTATALAEFLFSARFRSLIASTLGLNMSTVAIQGIRLPAKEFPEFPLHVEFYATGQAKKSNSAVAGHVDLEPYYSFVFATVLTLSEEEFEDGPFLENSPLGLVSKVALVADAHQGRIFPIDPPSQAGAAAVRDRRPTRPEAVLDYYYRRTVHNIPHPLVYAPDGYDDEVVVVCPGFVLEDHAHLPGTPKDVPLPGSGPPVRSNDASAVMAYWNVKQFFNRLRAYGMSPSAYFRIAGLPLEVHYRSGVGPGQGKDGQTVNARVRVKGFPDNFIGTIPGGNPPPLIEMHLALANLSTRARKPWNGKDRSPAEPLGIAADARWIWHEIGHVLLTASVGELEFRFAHSPGDALAAIVSDPESSLATDPNRRGSTFPWVFLPRRHDRCVTDGWSWSGGLHYGLSQVQDFAGPRRKSYWSEQILSSSLFRLYRCIGGDTTVVQTGPPPHPVDTYVRRSASHYCVYLIMRGIQILGSSLVSPTNEPDQFVSAMIDADINTASNTPSWHVVFRAMGIESPETYERIGGCVHKVIRWAFEAQGLYRSFTNTPGYPPPVDIFIESQRPTTDPVSGTLDFGKGSYVPVSLEWDLHQTESDPPPAWQAWRDPSSTGHDAIEVSPTGEIYVWVQNRGTYDAAGVTVRVWWHDWPNPASPPPPSPPPLWNDGYWEELGSTGQVQTVPPGGKVRFGPYTYTNAPAGRHIVLAEANCADDLGNTDTASTISLPPLPCSYRPTPLVDLVANDNNLGLRVRGP
ncbi:hypothetical protein ACVIWV_000440 [Bradyrhizobium diazoefficiens]|uniref:Uncharacterized protein n=2 Tax=Bradyrhizobium diazoefficiens TaxID=1355477 RepID=A0A0E4BL80_9BRAD|nr:hypothetical protein [Bradyrhizobium sp. LCT2]QHP68117.1 hypothetical protein EI171_13145 [Bradyrhizobium sp. LCT2]BAR55008.1 hypothetical protein NK6_1824 [Bradyrhizobium diazoefficiens]